MRSRHQPGRSHLKHDLHVGEAAPLRRSISCLPTRKKRKNKTCRPPPPSPLPPTPGKPRALNVNVSQLLRMTWLFGCFCVWLFGCRRYSELNWNLSRDDLSFVLPPSHPQVDGSGQRAEFITKKEAVVADDPLVVWVDGKSASSSEVRMCVLFYDRRTDRAGSLLTPEREEGREEGGKGARAV